jgi:peptidoglycan LD-endopeptidase CwlK
MPADLLTRVNLDALYPPFLERLLRGLAAARARGADYVATRGFASFGQQHHLRMLYLAGKGGKAAPAGLSAHNYGLAVDFCRDADTTKPGLQPDWKDAAYDILGEEMQREGLVWGASFKDRPHIQWPRFVNASQLEPLRKVWLITNGGREAQLRAVWSHVDAAASSSRLG